MIVSSYDVAFIIVDKGAAKSLASRCAKALAFVALVLNASRELSIKPSYAWCEPPWHSCEPVGPSSVPHVQSQTARPPNMRRCGCVRLLQRLSISKLRGQLWNFS
eukprot:2071881-Pleurochrysis_carterae.AAC.3